MRACAARRGGDPRLGAFVLSVDGRRAGEVRVRDSLTVTVQSGHHVLRIRQWWYRSPIVSLDISADQSVRLRAEVDRSTGTFRAWLRLVFKPWRALVLAPTTLTPRVPPYIDTSLGSTA